MEKQFSEPPTEKLIPEEILICFSGKERSRRAARAFRDGGVTVQHFDGGTKRILGMSIEEIKKTFSIYPFVTIIYEQGSKEEEYQAYIRARDKLKEAGVTTQTKDMFDIEIRLRDLNIDIMNYF